MESKTLQKLNCFFSLVANSCLNIVWQTFVRVVEALNILDVINCLRDENDGDLHVQLDVFEEELSADTEAMVESNKESIDINSHFDLFKAIYNKVNDTTLSLSLLSILYSLYQIDSNNPLCESTWQLIEKLSQQAVEGALKADKLMEEAKAQRRHVDVAVQTMESLSTSSSAVSSSRLQRKSAILSGTRPEASAPSEVAPPQPCAPPPPPSPPMPPPLVPPPPCPPPPPPLLGGYTPGPPPPPPLLGGFTPGAPPPPPPPPSVLGLKVPGAPPVPVPQLSPISVVTTIPTPEPNCQMKHFIWNKVPALQINKNSIWGDVSCMDGGIQIEYNKLEELFCAKMSKEEAKTDDKVTKAHASPNEISLLDPKRSMNVNIFLKQFRKNNAAIVDLIRKGEARNIGVEKLKGLIKILPLMDEAEMIQNYDGDADKLGNAEKFFMQLISVPCYKLRLELMLLKSDFQNQLSSVRSNLLLLSGICRRLYNNTALKKFLRLVLIAGNFINKGSNAGDAVGFKICSLNKLILTKSNDPKLSLLHVLVQEAEAKDKDALAFTDDLLEDLQKASRFSLENVKSEFHQIKTNVQKLLQQIQTQADEEIKDQFKEFLEEAEGDLSDIDESLELLVKQSHKLAHHFCENENSFNLEEFLSAFREFCDRVKVCQQEISSWKQQAEKAELRKRAHEELLEKRKSAQKELPPGARLMPGLAGTGDAKIVDNLVSEIRRGNVLRRLSVKRKSKPVPDVITESVRL